MRKPKEVQQSVAAPERGCGSRQEISDPLSVPRLSKAQAKHRQGPGKVVLVGAGPGDPDLLTIKAVRAMQSADVILFDDLVSDEILGYARDTAKRILVGKRGGRPSCRQEDINALMVRLARQGKSIVRLKSGDPTIFGRAGEEVAQLRAAGIDVSIVPGVTAGIAAAAQLGVSLTHRDCAQSVKFVTAHSRKGELPAVDWSACADPTSTLVVYMGGQKAPELAARLIAEGLPASTPALIAWAVSRPHERYHRVSLGALTTLNIDHSDPVLIGIGRVFAAAHLGQAELDLLEETFQEELIKKEAGLQRA